MKRTGNSSKKICDSSGSETRRTSELLAAGQRAWPPQIVELQTRLADLEESLAGIQRAMLTPEGMNTNWEDIRRALLEEIAHLQGKLTLEVMMHTSRRVATSPNAGEVRSEEDSRFHPSEDYRCIVFEGEKFTLTLNQAKMIEILHRAYQHGTPDVGKHLLLEAVESETGSVKDTFRSSPSVWKKVIRSARRSTYRLNLP